MCGIAGFAGLGDSDTLHRMTARIAHRGPDDAGHWTDESRLDALNEAVLLGIRARGRCVTSSTLVGGRFAIRPCFINPRSTLADADALVDEALTVAAELVENY